MTQQADPIIAGSPVVQFQPVLVDALGGNRDALATAIILQLVWSNRDSAGEAIMSAGEMSRRTGLAVPTIRRILAEMRRLGVMTSRRSGAYDSPYAWTVHPDALGMVWQ